ncbi:MAG: uncharacterized protein JWO98_1603 [Frankiales bacterium]|jgi:hypothetical protein|nr:uncharacterized protein [Frankiales bacterium]
MTRKQRLVAAGAGAAIVVLLAGFLLTTGGGHDSATAGSSSSAGSSSAAVTAATGASAPSTAASAGPTSTAPGRNPNDPPPSLPAVALDHPAAVGNGITARIVSTEAIQGSATGPGNTNGPALRFTVRITNGTTRPVSLDGVAVNLAYGSRATPASPLDDPSQMPFHGIVAPGKSADGVYVFSIAVKDRASVTLTVGYRAGAPILVFTGPAR